MSHKKQARFFCGDEFWVSPCKASVVSFTLKEAYYYPMVRKIIHIYIYIYIYIYIFALFRSSGNILLFSDCLEEA